MKSLLLEAILLAIQVVIVVVVLKPIARWVSDALIAMAILIGIGMSFRRR